MENKRDDKKELVLEAALKVFSEQGFAKAKISKIAEIAGIATGSVYLQFSNKEQIMEELLFRSWSNIEQRLNTLEASRDLTAKQKIQLLISAMINLANEKRDLAALVLHEYSFWSSGSSHKVRDTVTNAKSLLNKIIQEGIASDNFRKDLPAELATAFLIGGIWHVIGHFTENNSELNINSIQNDIEKLVFYGYL